MLGTSRTIHLINPLWNAAGGSESRTLELYQELKGHSQVTLWSEFQPDPRLAARYPIRRIMSRRLKFPKTGTFIFVGVYRHPGKWVHLAVPRRVIVVYNTPDPELFARQVQRLSRFGSRTVEVVYASPWLERSARLPGVVHPSLVDLGRFVPRARGTADGSGWFTVGRLSRDIPEKHHADDPRFYGRLVAAGCRIRIMGGTCLTEQLEGAMGVELLPPCTEEPEVFLQGLDCFFYRTASRLTEAFGRVVVEAMACGLPVVCENRGGYVDLIDSGRNGFLFDSEEHAFDTLLRLKADRKLREVIGLAGRETVQALLSPQRRRAMADFYLR